MTTVVNLRDKPYDVYIGRCGKGVDGYFGNPHPIGYCRLCNSVHDRRESIAAFKKYFLLRIETDSQFKERVMNLKGKVLGCFCKSSYIDVPCHGDIYVDFLDSL